MGKFALLSIMRKFVRAYKDFTKEVDSISEQETASHEIDIEFRGRDRNDDFSLSHTLLPAL